MDFIFSDKKSAVLQDCLPWSGTRYLVSRFSTEKCHDRGRLSAGVVLVTHACSKFVSLEPSVM